MTSRGPFEPYLSVILRVKIICSSLQFWDSGLSVLWLY